jgi:hypothetical protein
MLVLNVVPTLLFGTLIGFIVVSPAQGQIAALGQEFTLRVGESVLIKETCLKISFSHVAEDSRCAKGVVCVWAGNGKIVVKVNGDKGMPVAVELNTTIEPKQSRFHKYIIKLVDLHPYPQKDVKIKRSYYVAALVINKWRSGTHHRISTRNSGCSQ